MQHVEKSKETVNGLLENYRPIGPRHLLAAALMLQSKKDAGEPAVVVQPRAAAAA